MSGIQLYLVAFDRDKTEAQRIVAESARQLEARETKLIDLVTSLEPYINHKDDGSLRAKSVAYLAAVLHSLPPNVLSGQERHLLCEFILGRLEGDVEGVGSSAEALMALENLGKWDKATAQKVMQTFINHTQPLRQFKLQTERYSIVRLLDLLLAKYRKALQELHDADHEFMTAFISYFDGEKDPRNLMIIFSVLQVPMTEWNIHHNAQDLFDSVFNYFPITFKQPPDDPYGITAQDLKDRLRDCISANSDFAPFAFPQLLDKLDSTSMNTKRDVIQAIQACVLGYEAKTINLYSVTLWDALKFEILNLQEEDLAKESLTALSLIAAKLETADGPLNAFLRPIIKECKEHLEDAPTKQSEAAGRILHAVASSTPIAADKIAKGILPTLFVLYTATDSVAKRRGLLEVFNSVVSAYIIPIDSKLGLDTKILKEYAINALQIMINAVSNAPKSEVSFRLTALSGLTLLCSIPTLLSDTDINLVVDTVTDIVLHEHIDGHGDIKSQAVKALTELAASVPNAVRDRTIPSFMVELPDAPSEDSIPKLVLEDFVQLSSERQIFDTVILRLRNKYNAARHQKAPLEYQRAMLLALLYSFTYGSPYQENGVIISDYFTNYAEPLMYEVAKTREDDRNSSILEVIGRIVNVTLRPQSVHFQSSVFNRHVEWISPLTKSEEELKDHIITLTPFRVHYHAALRPEVFDPSKMIELMREQAQLVLGGQIDRPVAAAIQQHMSLLINKFANPREMQVTLQSCHLDVEALLSTNRSPAALDTAFAVVKALLIQGRSVALASKYLQILFDYLDSADQTDTAGEGMAHRFIILLAPDDILTKENHCNVSSLHRQRTFHQALPRVVATVQDPDSTRSNKDHHLIALSGLLRWLPYSIIQPVLSTITPLVLQTLSLEPLTSQIHSPALTVLEATLLHDPAVLAEHVPGLITRLLTCCGGASQMAPPGVRAQALRALALVPRRLKREAVVPFQRTVVKRLLACLDDGRRSVRAEAVRCRMAWLGLEEGGGEED